MHIRMHISVLTIFLRYMFNAYMIYECHAYVIYVCAVYILYTCCMHTGNTNAGRYSADAVRYNLL